MFRDLFCLAYPNLLCARHWIRSDVSSTSYSVFLIGLKHDYVLYCFHPSIHFYLNEKSNSIVLGILSYEVTLLIAVLGRLVSYKCLLSGSDLFSSFPIGRVP